MKTKLLALVLRLLNILKKTYGYQFAEKELQEIHDLFTEAGHILEHGSVFTSTEVKLDTELTDGGIVSHLCDGQVPDGGEFVNTNKLVPDYQLIQDILDYGKEGVEYSVSPVEDTNVGQVTDSLTKE